MGDGASDTSKDVTVRVSRAGAGGRLGEAAGAQRRDAVEEFVLHLEDSVGDAKWTWEKGQVTRSSEGREVGSGLRICGLGLTHVLSLPRTFTVPVPHPNNGLPLSSAEPAYTPVPHDVLHGTPPVG